jgi:hypothetical protein
VAEPFTPRIARMVTHSEMWYHYMTESGNWHGGNSTHWIATLSAAPISDNCQKLEKILPILQFSQSLIK